MASREGPMKCRRNSWSDLLEIDGSEKFLTVVVSYEGIGMNDSIFSALKSWTLTLYT